ncbi:hypothetical protein O181_020655 [Austropuccinia psidii MF-1]|uniref:Uncharacterized protein n=1 Tax=Austropuccinia psidii MF-1 TaxID=1389203 RepID=A0A9Q3GWB1_9BASI|nr:hypothetical protein [Austropuccinia psidii MF-1]
MHNLILGILKDNATFKLCIPDSKSKIHFSLRRKSNDTNNSDSDSMISNSSLDQITMRERPAPGSVDIASFDADYIPAELDISALSDHQIKGEALEHLQQIIPDTTIPSSWTRVPHKMGSPSHGSLKAADWVLLYKAYVPFLILSQHMSLDEHNSPITQRKIGQS